MRQVVFPAKRIAALLSGGPLINMQGGVVGSCTAIVTSGQGIGFAIPGSMARAIVGQLRGKGKATRGGIGVSVQPVTAGKAKSLGLKEGEGVFVADVMAGPPAHEADISKGDVILAFNGKDLKAISDLPLEVAQTPAGKSVRVRLLRDGGEITFRPGSAKCPMKKRVPLPRNPGKILLLRLRCPLPERSAPPPCCIPSAPTPKKKHRRF